MQLVYCLRSLNFKFLLVISGIGNEMVVRVKEFGQWHVEKILLLHASRDFCFEENE